MCSADLSLDGDFIEQDISKYGLSTNWSNTWCSDIGYLESWPWNNVFYNTQIIIGWSDTYLYSNIRNSRALCMLANLETGDYELCELDCGSEFAKWNRLIVNDGIPVLAGLSKASMNSEFDRLIVGTLVSIGCVPTSTIVSYQYPFPGVNFRCEWIRIEYCNDTIEPYYIVIAAGNKFENGNEVEVIEAIALRATDFSCIAEGTLELPIWISNLNPFALRYYANTSETLMLMSYYSSNLVKVGTYLHAYHLAVDRDNEIITFLPSAAYKVQVQLAYPHDCPVELHGVYPKDFCFTDDGTDIENFTGYGCGVMQREYETSHDYKHIWLFEFCDSGVDRSNISADREVPALSFVSPSTSCIRVNQVPNSNEGMYDLHVFDISGRIVLRENNIALLRLTDGIETSLQSGIYFVVLYSLNEDYNLYSEVVILN